MALNVTQKLIRSHLIGGEMAPGAEIALRMDQALLQDVLGPPTRRTRRTVGLGAVCLYVALVAATFAFLYPVLTGQPLDQVEWQRRMWFPSWF